MTKENKPQKAKEGLKEKNVMIYRKSKGCPAKCHSTKLPPTNNNRTCRRRGRPDGCHHRRCNRKRSPAGSGREPSPKEEDHRHAAEKKKKTPADRAGERRTSLMNRSIDRLCRRHPQAQQGAGSGREERRLGFRKLRERAERKVLERGNMSNLKA
ncbi:hypothetical protein Q3G72_020381 [Acer saccharum]|nr:hypothetical protein Q3G72_020381 [Acer saccharum]